MTATLELLDRALEQRSASEWARSLGVHRCVFTDARNRGHLTPVVAGGLALEMGEDPREWITVAVIEGEKESPAKQALAKKLASWRKRWLSFTKGLKIRAAGRGRRSA